MTFRTIWGVETVRAEDEVWRLAQNSEGPQDPLRRDGAGWSTKERGQEELRRW